jgi:hypothetical protein
VHGEDVLARNRGRQLRVVRPKCVHQGFVMTAGVAQIAVE